MPLPPVDVLHLFSGERQELLKLLRGLHAEDWTRPTACEGWTVHDVSLHLLGDDLGKLSGGRDGHTNPAFADGIDISTFSGLVQAIDRQNEQWVRATRRISPRLTIELLELSGHLTAEYFRTLDLDAIGQSVDWAGAGAAPVWFDLAREFTERWHHQQHIRDAVGNPGMMEPTWFRPVLETFMRGLYRSLENVDQEPGATLTVTVTGSAGGTWFAIRRERDWDLSESASSVPDASVTLSPEIAWKLFTRGISPEQARKAANVSGNAALVDAVFNVVSILAE